MNLQNQKRSPIKELLRVVRQMLGTFRTMYGIAPCVIAVRRSRDESPIISSRLGMQTITAFPRANVKPPTLTSQKGESPWTSHPIAVPPVALQNDGSALSPRAVAARSQNERSSGADTADSVCVLSGNDIA